MGRSTDEPYAALNATAGTPFALPVAQSVLFSEEASDRAVEKS
jgi:hypothetical protein